LSSELVERAQSGDREAFDALAAGAYDGLYAVAHRMLRDGQAAEDAVQEALIKAWRDIRSLRELGRFDAWLHRLLVRSCYDQSRRRRRFSVEVADTAVDRSDPADRYAEVADRDELERAFLHLSMEHRAVLVLTHYVGLPAPEVARILQIPPGTVYSRLHYAVRTMRRAIVGGDPSGAIAVPEHGR
jgi:RNA polymerase sigma factor (sigma-70 family)